MSILLLSLPEFIVLDITFFALFVPNVVIS
jgi:hypothetical protein